MTGPQVVIDGEVGEAGKTEAKADVSEIASELGEAIEAWVVQSVACEKAITDHGAMRNQYLIDFSSGSDSTMEMAVKGEDVQDARRNIRTQQELLEKKGVELAADLAAIISLADLQELAIGDRTYTVERDQLVLKTIEGNNAKSEIGESLVFATKATASELYQQAYRAVAVKPEHWAQLVQDLLEARQD